MGIQAAEISAILKDQIKNFGQDAEVAEVGQVLSVGDGIARVHGLDKVQAGELVEFPGGLRGMARALERVSDRLSWEYGYEKVPRALAQKYAYCEIAGPQGPVRSERLILGFVLFAPNTTYPQHSHHDIEESYVSVAGAWSENDTAVHAPGSLVLNVPGHEHRITTGRFDPVLLAYAWVGPDDRLSAPGMKFSRSRKLRVEQGI